MKKHDPMRRAVEALQGGSEPFAAMTSLLFLASITHERAGTPLTDLIGPEPTAADLNEILEGLERQFPDHLGGALVAPQLADVRQSAIAECLTYVQRFLDQRDPVQQRDIFGTAFMDAQAHSTKQALGAFHSPPCIGQLMARMVIAPEPAQWVYEPTCGTGALLLAVIDEAVERLGPVVAESITYIGVELDPRAARLARMNMVLARQSANSHIFCGNTLAHDIVAPNASEGGRLHRIEFHCCIGNPPFGGSVKLPEVMDDPFVIPDRLLNRPIAVPSEPDESAAA